MDCSKIGHVACPSLFTNSRGTNKSVKLVFSTIFKGMWNAATVKIDCQELFSKLVDIQKTKSTDFFESVIRVLFGVEQASTSDMTNSLSTIVKPIYSNLT